MTRRLYNRTSHRGKRCHRGVITFLAMIRVHDIIRAMTIAQAGKVLYRTLSFLLVFSLLTVSAAAAQAEGKGNHFLWKVQDGSSTAYLLGSIHVLKKGFYPLSKVIEDAFESSSVLAVEANVDDVSKIDMTNMVGKAMYPAGDSLEKHLSPERYDLVKKELAADGMPPELIEMQRPWFIALTLTSFELMKAGYDPAYGIDQHFISEAEGKKKIVELEGFDYQVNLLSGLSDKEQEAFLLSTIHDLHTLDRDADGLVSAWKAGDTRAMASLVSREGQEQGMATVYEKILYRRNRNMADKVEDLLRKGQTAFIVVGAGHLVGEKGIIAILRERGYQVNQL
jgi:uncharacterized protein YbaP (TraB family)